MQGFYIYGLATHPGQQGKGFGSRLLAYALEDAPFYLLYPATPELQRFYHKRGFTTPVRIPDAVSRKLTVPGVQDIHSKLLYRQYLENAGNQDFVFLWSAPLFDFAIGECFFRKGFISPPFFCYPEEDQVLCKPFLSAANSGEYSYLHGRAKFNVPFPGFDTEKSTFYLPLD